MTKVALSYRLPQIIKKNRTIYIKDSEDFSGALKAYLKVSASEDIDSLCKPLKDLGIFYFLYVKRFKDGSQVEITNHPASSEHYYKNHYYKIGPFRDPKHLYSNGIFLWSSLDCSQVHLDIRNLFNIDHGITIVNKYDDCNEFYHFGANADNPQIINFYLNNIDLLKRFILFFKDKSREHIRICENYRIMLPQSDSYAQSTPYEEVVKKIRERFIKLTPIDRFHVGNRHPYSYLTHREMECLRWHAIGKSATEIAMILSISSRTVEVHLENVKKKLNCFKQTQLGYQYAGFSLAEEHK